MCFWACVSGFGLLRQFFQRGSLRLKFTIQIIQALIDLHSINPNIDSLTDKILIKLKFKTPQKRYITHNDLHCKNICLDENNNIKLVDFGLSKIVDHEFELLNDIYCLKTIIEEIWQVNKPGNNLVPEQGWVQVFLIYLW